MDCTIALVLNSWSKIHGLIMTFEFSSALSSMVAHPKRWNLLINCYSTTAVCYNFDILV